MIKWVYLEKAFDWKRRGLTVIADYHDEDGQRYHLVKEAGFSGQAIDNARIYSEQEKYYEH